MKWVELNTAESAKQIEAVRHHIAKVEGHLDDQSRRVLLAKRAEGVAISVKGSGPDSEPLPVRFTLKDPNITLVRADLLNGALNLFGTVHCSSAGPLEFVGEASPDSVRNWYQGGTVSVNYRRAIW